MSAEPAVEGAVRLPQREDDARVVNHGVDLEAVPDNAGVREEAAALLRTVARDDVRVEAVERAAERVALAEDGRPREARLVDLEREALEELGEPERRKLRKLVGVLAYGDTFPELAGGAGIARSRRPPR